MAALGLEELLACLATLMGKCSALKMSTSDHVAPLNIDLRHLSQVRPHDVPLEVSALGHPLNGAVIQHDWGGGEGGGARMPTKTKAKSLGLDPASATRRRAKPHQWG